MRLDTRCGFPPRSCFHLRSLFFLLAPRSLRIPLWTNNLVLCLLRTPNRRTRYLKFSLWSNTGHHCILFLLYLGLSFTINRVFFPVFIACINLPTARLRVSLLLVCSSFEVHCIQPLLVVSIISTQRADGKSVSGTSFLVRQDVGLLFLSPWFGAG